MKIGGRAYKNGVALFGEHYSVKAYYQEDRLVYEVGTNALANNKLYQLARKIPILRGIINLVVSIYYFLKEAASRPQRFWPILLLLGIDLILEIYLSLFPVQSAQVINKVFFLPPIIYWGLLVILAVILRQTVLKEIFKFHGAEHKAVNYYQDQGEQAISSYSRLARRCGTNLVAVYVLLLGIIEYLGWGFNIWVETLLLLGIAYELLLIMPDKLMSIPFLFQRFTTVEPESRQLTAAQTALEVLIEKETEADDQFKD